MSKGKIEGVRCVIHNAELTRAMSGDAKADRAAREAMRDAVAKHKREVGGGCKIERVTA